MITISLPLVINISVIVGCVLCLLYWYQTKNFSYWKDRGVPFVKPHWFFGNVGFQILQRKTCTDISKDLYNKFKDTGFVGIFVFWKPAIFVCDLGLIEKILIQDFTYFENRYVDCNPEEPLSDNPLYNVSGVQWRKMRHNLTTTFSSSKVKNMCDQVFKCGDFLIKDIEKSTDNKKIIDVEHLAFTFTTEVFASCFCGVQLMSDPIIAQRFREALNIVFQCTPLKLVKTFISIQYPNLFRRLNIKYTPSSIMKFFANLTQETIRYRKENNKERDDFLQMMMGLKEQEERERFECSTKKYSNGNLDLKGQKVQQNEKLFSFETCFTDNNIHSLVFNFLVAGTKPCVSTLAFILLEIAKNPTIQTNLQEEIDSCTAKHCGLNYQAINEMEYLDQIIQETHRLYTFEKVITRLVTKVYRIPGSDVTLEKGTIVYIPVSAIHSDPNIYPEPEVFDPKRFAGNNYKASCRFLPFGNGPRMCISVRFVALLMKVFVARIMSKYFLKLEINPSNDLDHNACGRQPKNGVWLSIYKR